MHDSLILYNSNGEICRIVHPDPNLPFDPTDIAWNVSGGAQVRVKKTDYDAIASSADDYHELMKFLQPALELANPAVADLAQTKIDAIAAKMQAAALMQTKLEAEVAAFEAAVPKDVLDALASAETQADIDTILAKLSPGQIAKYNAIGTP